ncbi:MAG TPA: 2-C-methyl-D-erythritol 4-phosphate cytidylyltransferase [Conexibacter sp.]|jgi:2-C-methyl-D-erythritol 4-phosphate cytidylyltransferase|nr:2-C-methyl-D-erythritol 4-phosphate cytidylyltransferase [Conexibacter sp.]
MAVALLVAAGRGERLGAGGPKAFVVLAGRPMLEWSLDALRAVAAVERIVVALPPGVAAPPGVVGVAGGVERSQSVRAALAAAGDISDDEAVIVHDAARPLATTALFAHALEELAARGCDAVVAAARVTDTIKRAAADGAVVETLDRSALWAVQTPQVFRRGALARALAQQDAVLAAATDDAGLVEQAGGSVHVIESPADNLKVTTPTDLRLATLLLDERHRC